MLTVLFLRSLFFALLLPGNVTLVVPYLILSGRGSILPPAWGIAQILGVVPLVSGAAILIRCIRDFAVVGRGTLAPIDPPRQLVIRGLYRYVRNPMYVGVGLILVGEALVFASTNLILYAAAVLTAMHVFVVLYEEPALEGQFGDSYRQYRHEVGRWLPRWRAR